MRPRALRPLAVAAILGAVAGALVAVAGQAWAVRDLPREFTFVSYSPVPDDLSFGLADSWWQLLWPAVVTGLVIAVLGVIVLMLRRDGRHSAPRGWRGLLALGAIGVVLGGAVGGALYLRAGPDGATTVTYGGRYVPMPGVDLHRAYSSTLSITVDRQPQNVAGFLAVCIATGLAIALLVSIVIAVAQRRRA